MSATTQELRDRVKARGRIPGCAEMAHHGLCVCAAAIIMDDLGGSVRALLQSGLCSPAEYEGIASALLVVEERVNQALERVGKEVCRT